MTDQTSTNPFTSSLLWTFYFEQPDGTMEELDAHAFVEYLMKGSAITENEVIFHKSGDIEFLFAVGPYDPALVMEHASEYKMFIADQKAPFLTDKQYQVINDHCQMMRDCIEHTIQEVRKMTEGPEKDARARKAAANAIRMEKYLFHINKNVRGAIPRYSLPTMGTKER